MNLLIIILLCGVLEEVHSRSQDHVLSPHRELSSETCPNDSNLKKDAVWYEMQLMVTSTNDLECSDYEWNEIRDCIDAELKKADLYEDLGIYSLDPHVCQSDLHRGLSTIGTLKDLSPRALRKLEGDGAGVELRAVVFHLFYSGGGKCFFCTEDNTDLNSRSLEGTYNKTKNSSRFSKDPNSLLRGASSKQVNNRDEGMSWARRRLGCDWILLDFEKYANGQEITTEPYIGKDEYWDSHGINIEAIPKSRKKGYAPDGMARIFDTSFQVDPNKDSDRDLGSPNHECPDGGPGEGDGGKPLMDNGQPNPGANCEPQGNVLIIQKSDELTSDDSGKGGKLEFTFKTPVTLNKVGLMDTQADSGEKIIVYTEEGATHVHVAQGYGNNSVETVELFRKKVTKVEIEFDSGGAVLFLDYYRNCDEDEERAAAIEEYYPTPDERAYENMQSVMDFESMVPAIDETLSKLLEDKVHEEFSGEASHCLYQQEISVEVMVHVSTPVAASDCHHHGDRA